MILPSAVHVTKAADLEAQRAENSSGMIRQGALVGKSDKMCATGAYASPLRPSRVCPARPLVMPLPSLALYDVSMLVGLDDQSP